MLFPHKDSPPHPFLQLATPIGPTSKISTDPAAPEASKLKPAARQDDPFAASIGPSGSQNYKYMYHTS